MKYSTENPYDLTTEELEKVEARKEKYERKIRDQGITDDQIRAQAEKVIKGITQWDRGRTRQTEWTQSLRDKKDRFRRDIGEPIPENVFSDVPPVIKRTPQERLESLTKRLIKAHKQGGDNTVIVESLLGQIQTELFAMTGYRLGEQPAIEDIRALSAFFLNKAEQEANRKKGSA